MKRFAIYAGLGGSFGGVRFDRVEWYETQSEADDAAYETACSIYETYDGMYGLDSLSDLMQENPDLSEDEAEEMWREQREGWLDYYTVELSDNQIIDDGEVVEIVE